MTDDLLALTVDLPERSLSAGEVVYREGDAVTTVLVLVEGQLEVDRGGVIVNRHGLPGSVVGEIGALLHQPRAATVTAKVPSVIREIGDPDEFLAAHPQVAARGGPSARRAPLPPDGVRRRRTAAVRPQRRPPRAFGELLHRIAERPAVDIEPGSDRSPDY